ncbi:hypothetical protein JKF63_01533 [Porcisia hertigi]|uniref:Diacylglycerol kinase n=1 Tax=Porcisia hertigi TaxID=2761500 RepID=A0A836LA34_9TRYP|nr:hypothetical protein JKF63_01533 [Porcisia hertigi]
MPPVPDASREKRNLGAFVALVNLRSGGRCAAQYVHRKLSDTLGAGRVWVLFEGKTPENHRVELDRFLCRHAPEFVIVAGGDGTISFAMSTILRLHEQHLLAARCGVLAPFPLGTGNDFSFTLGFGIGFSRWMVLGERRFQRLIRAYEEAAVTNVDRWSLHVTTSTGQHSRSVVETHVLSNYFSVGFDAAVANRLNRFRRRHLHLFMTRPVIKLWYAVFAFIALFTTKRIGSSTLLEIDGRRVAVPLSAKSVAVCNMLTYAGGAVAWNGAASDHYSKPSVCDGRLEVVCFYGIWHLALVRLGWCYGEKLGQGSSVRIRSNCRTCQFDGEEILCVTDAKGQSTFCIDHFCTSECLVAPPQQETDSSALLFAIAALVVIVVLILCTSFFL